MTYIIFFVPKHMHKYLPKIYLKNRIYDKLLTFTTPPPKTFQTVCNGNISFKN